MRGGTGNGMERVFPETSYRVRMKRKFILWKMPFQPVPPVPDGPVEHRDTVHGAERRKSMPRVPTPPVIQQGDARATVDVSKSIDMMTVLDAEKNGLIDG